MIGTGKFEQAKCPACGGWHFAVTFKEGTKEIKEIKCCRAVCGKLFSYPFGIDDVKPDIKEKSED